MNSQEYVVRKLGRQGKTNKEIADYCSIDLEYVESILGGGVQEEEVEEVEVEDISKRGRSKKPTDEVAE